MKLRPATETLNQPITKGSRVSQAEVKRFKNEFRPRYEQGASIRQLVAESGRSYGVVHRLLRRSGVQLRGYGGSRRGGTDQSRKASLGFVEVSGELVSPPTVNVLTALNTANQHVTVSWVEDQIPHPAPTIYRALDRLAKLKCVTVLHPQPASSKRQYGRRFKITGTGRRVVGQIARRTKSEAMRDNSTVVALRNAQKQESNLHLPSVRNGEK